MYWHSQAAIVRRAMADGGATTLAELLLMRDTQGHMARHLEPPPGATPRPAAALLLLYPQDGELYVPLTVRTGHLPTHKGQVALPGGSLDPEDDGPVSTALREAEEELADIQAYDKAQPTVRAEIASGQFVTLADYRAARTRKRK